MDDTVLKSALAATRGRRRSAGACLDDAQSALFATGELDEAGYAAAAAHVAACDDCLDRIAALVELGRDEARPDAPADKPAHGVIALPGLRLQNARFRHRMPLAVAASVVVMVLGALVLGNAQLLPWQEPTAYRQVRSAADAIAVPALRFPPEAHKLARRELRFEWAAVDDAMYYELQLLSENGDVLWQQRADGTQLAPPAALHLEPDTLFYAWVRAHLNDGKTVKSQAISFRVMTEG